ncbi:MAG: Multiple RNA-binding domain-containing protein 1 [Thelocarpon impressellum]|nr:MAG: Multiple RNA-binding domain-containing protein 1 [Thelocarpon impressellum]
MESSRIFVRGLPPSLSEEEFKKHFLTQNSITDAKLIPHRRIGYVGYRSSEDAVKAVNEAVVKGAKRKRDEQSRAEDPKLREFLEVMQPPSKSKTWANEGLPAAAELAQPKMPSRAVGGEEPGDDEYEKVPRRTKKTRLDAQEKPVANSALITQDPQAQKTPGDDQIAEEVPLMPIAETDQVEQVQGPGVSDSDWLRSRTSRLLGLEDDFEETTGPDVTAINDPTPAKTSPEVVVAGEEVDSGQDGTSEPQEDADTNATTTDTNIDAIKATGRLFIRNLPYSASEGDLRTHFLSYGTLQEANSTGKSKGFAYIQYDDFESAVKAYRSTDGKPFQGRLVHVIPAAAKRENKLDEFAISKLPLKKQKELRRKAEAASSTFNWNSMYMSADAVMSSISDRLGVSKSDLLDPTSSDAAVKQAHSETHIIQETKAYLTSNGVDLEAFKRRERGDTVILVKNFSYGTRTIELRDLFEEFGKVTRILMPPAGTIAIVEFAQAPQARAAFASLAYRRFKDSVLFLEKAPQGLLTTNGGGVEPATVSGVQEPKASTSDIFQSDTANDVVETTTLFVRNLNFCTTSDSLTEIFKPLEGFQSARVKTKSDPKKPGQILSMGFGFLEFRTKGHAQAALSAMNGYNLDGHSLLIRASHKGVDAGEDRKKEDRAKKLAGKRTKVIVKNLPFEASAKDVRSLLGSYGQLRSVRVPKKFDSSARGFAFADFVTAREAENAMEALKDTHLLGRRLVLDFAAEDPVDAEEEIEKMQKKVGKQANKMALQRLTGGGRKKFNVDGDEEAEV